MKKKSDLSEAAIDDIVIRQAEDEAAWDEPIEVRVQAPATLALPSELAARAAFFARLHRMPDAATWLRTIIEERIAFEEAAFADLKQAMASSSGSDD
ncbi:MAG: hypothetical protein KC425_11880 [Anaerolineales bacterium]|nr:hypothetical protein [Anaerolineales bacterium]